jgi:hypothetical protein
MGYVKGCKQAGRCFGYGGDAAGRGGFGRPFFYGCDRGVLRGVRAVWCGDVKGLVRDCFSETAGMRACHGTWHRRV